MATNYKLTWVERGTTGRWRKRYKGRWLSYSGDGGKVASYARAWKCFQSDKLRIDTEEQANRPITPQEQVADYYRDALTILQSVLLERRPDSEETRAAWKLIEAAKQSPPKAQTGVPAYDGDAAVEAIAKVVGQIVPSDDTPKKPPTGIPPWAIVSDERDDSQVDTVGLLVKSFLDNQRQQVELKEISPSRYDKLRVVTDKLLAFVGSDLPLSDFGNELLLKWRTEVSRLVIAKTMAPVTGRDTLAITKRLVRWAHAREIIDSLPRCIGATGKDAYTISLGSTEITPADVGDFKLLWASASTDKERLVLLLGINCGYGPRDISGILKSEIDLQAGTITRTRTKTSKHRKPPVITYTLWPETLAAVKANLSSHETLAFLTERGNPLVNETIGNDGIVKRHDAVHSIWFRLVTKAKSKTKLKQLRKLGATLLKQEFPQFVDRYLGHVASTVADRHYASEHEVGFREALVWLRGQVMPTAKPKR